MNPTQTAQSTQNSGTAATPFEQIKELERREKERVEKELLAMQREKEEVSVSVAKKEEQASEELKAQAKKELKQYSETELTSIVTEGQKEAEKECSALESSFESKKDAAVNMLVENAKNPDTFFLKAA